MVEQGQFCNGSNTGFGGCNGTPGPDFTMTTGNTPQPGGTGGGSNSVQVDGPSGSPVAWTVGTGNTGGGGNQGSAGTAKHWRRWWSTNPRWTGAGAGGSGIVIIRYKFQNIIVE